MLVVLNEAEVAMAFKVAERRYTESRQMNLKTGYITGVSTTVEGEVYLPDKQGALAEAAVAKGLELEWKSAFPPHPEWWDPANRIYDVGSYEVRATRYRTGRLILRPKDLPETPYILVVSHSDYKHHIIGWCYGKEGMVDEFWKDDEKTVATGPPAWFVPQERLRPLRELPT